MQGGERDGVEDGVGDGVEDGGRGGRPSVEGWRAGAADLLLGGRCVGCARPGRLVCSTCRPLLVPAPHRADPEPRPPGLVPCWAGHAYADLVREVVVTHKEHGLQGLGPALGAALAPVVSAACPGRGPLLLVPVPSRPSSVRARGHDPTHSLVARAATLLDAEGRPVAVARLLRTRRGLADQTGLDARGRWSNLAGSLWCPSGRLARVASSRRGPVHVVVCDDVLTTGATAREAQRALEAAGVRVHAVAAVAGTRLRVAARPGQPGWALPMPPATH